MTNRDLFVAPRLDPCGRLGGLGELLVHGDEPVRVRLVDPTPILEAVQDMITQSLMDDTRLEAILIPAVDYFTVRDYLDTQVVRGGSATGGAITYMDIRLLLDPRSDHGEIIPIYTDEAAWDVFTMRKKQ